MYDIHAIPLQGREEKGGEGKMREGEDKGRGRGKGEEGKGEKIAEHLQQVLG